MNKQIIAKELLKMAKELTADSGDVVAYFNVSDFFKGKLSPDQASEAEKVLSDAVFRVRRELDRVVRDELMRSRHGTAFKNYDLELT